MQQSATVELGALEARLRDNLRLIEAMLADRRMRSAGAREARIIIDAIQEKRQRFQDHFQGMGEAAVSPAA